MSVAPIDVHASTGAREVLLIEKQCCVKCGRGEFWRVGEIIVARLYGMLLPLKNLIPVVPVAISFISAGINVALLLTVL